MIDTEAASAAVDQERLKFHLKREQNTKGRISR